VKTQLKESQFPLSRKDVLKIIDRTENFRDRLIIKLLAYTGIRRDEVINITYSDVNFKENLLRIVGKGQKVRYVPITGDVKTDILKQFDGRKRGFLFPAKRLKRTHLKAEQINRIVIAAGDRAGVKHPNPDRKQLYPHLFRHTFAHLCRERGMDWPVLRDLLGHTTVSVTMDQYGRTPLEKIKTDYREVMAFA